jgi:hypothetical protein
MASSNLKHTTFTESKNEVVTEMRESPVASGMGAATSRVMGKSLPLINADLKAAVSTQQSAVSKGKGKPQPRAAVPHEHRVG